LQIIQAFFLNFCFNTSQLANITSRDSITANAIPCDVTCWPPGGATVHALNRKTGFLRWADYSVDKGSLIARYTQTITDQHLLTSGQATGTNKRCLPLLWEIVHSLKLMTLRPTNLNLFITRQRGSACQFGKSQNTLLYRRPQSLTLCESETVITINTKLCSMDYIAKSSEFTNIDSNRLCSGLPAYV
jgi:hypothetical protein